MSDAPMLLAWRNDPETRRWSTNTAAVTVDEHHDWLRKTFDADDRILLIAERGGEPVGTVRFDRRGRGIWEVSITIAPEHRGAGCAQVVLNAAQQYLAEDHDVRELRAIVHTGNAASLALFDRAGYRRDPDASVEETGPDHVALRRGY